MGGLSAKRRDWDAGERPASANAALNFTRVCRERNTPDIRARSAQPGFNPFATRCARKADQRSGRKQAFRYDQQEAI
jgi:hypothetical protein